MGIMRRLHALALTVLAAAPLCSCAGEPEVLVRRLGNLPVSHALEVSVTARVSRRQALPEATSSEIEIAGEGANATDLGDGIPCFISVWDRVSRRLLGSLEEAAFYAIDGVKHLPPTVCSGRTCRQTVWARRLMDTEAAAARPVWAGTFKLHVTCGSQGTVDAEFDDIVVFNPGPAAALAAHQLNLEADDLNQAASLAKRGLKSSKPTGQRAPA